MAIVTRFFSVSATAAGLEIPNIIGPHAEVPHSGTLEQVVIRAVSGGGAQVDKVQLRYDEGDGATENLPYFFEDGPYSATDDGPTFVDSSIHAPFSLKNVNVPNDLTFYFEPAAAGFFEIRIDLNLDAAPGHRW